MGVPYNLTLRPKKYPEHPGIQFLDLLYLKTVYSPLILYSILMFKTFSNLADFLYSNFRWFFRSSVKSGRAKRNATFPGGIATTYTPQYPANPAPAIQTPPVKCESGSGESSSGGSNAVTEDITVPSPTPDPTLTSPTPGRPSIHKISKCSIFFTEKKMYHCRKRGVEIQNNEKL